MLGLAIPFFFWPMDWQYFGRNIAKIVNVWAIQRDHPLSFSFFCTFLEKKKKSCLPEEKMQGLWTRSSQ